MRVLLVLTAVLLFAMPASAGSGNGGDLTSKDNVLWLHADQDTGETWMSNAQDEENRFEGGFGQGGVHQPLVAAPPASHGRPYFVYPLVPAPSYDVALDPDGNIEVLLRVGSSGGGGYMEVAPTLYVGDEVLAAGEYLTSLYVQQYVTFTWTLTPQMATIPAGSTVTLEVDIVGAGVGAYVWMEGENWSRVTLPVTSDLPVQDDEEEEETETTTTTSSTSNATTSTSSTTTTTTTTEADSTAETDTTTSDATVEQEPVQEVNSDADAPGLAVAAAFVALVGLALVRRRL